VFASGSVQGRIPGSTSERESPGGKGRPGVVLHCTNLADLLPGKEVVSWAHLPERAANSPDLGRDLPAPAGGHRANDSERGLSDEGCLVGVLHRMNLADL